MEKVATTLHQGIQQAIPELSAGPPVGHGLGPIRAVPVLVAFIMITSESHSNGMDS
jgi:hypothetical protein